MKFSKDRFASAIRQSPLSVQRIATASGISRPMIYAYMNGTYQPGAETLAAVAAALGLPMEHFFCPSCPVFETEGSPDDGPAA